jgi:hypothetical protein
MRQIQIGDTCSVIKRLLHPAKLIAEKYPNQDHRETLDDLLVTGIDRRRINRSMKAVVLFRHADFENKILYCATRYARIVVPGETIQQEVEPEIPEELIEVPNVIGDNLEDVQRLRVEGYNVDDDNDPAPENVPNPNDANHVGYDPSRVQYGTLIHSATEESSLTILRMPQLNLTKIQMEVSVLIGF